MSSIESQPRRPTLPIHRVEDPTDRRDATRAAELRPGREWLAADPRIPTIRAGARFDELVDDCKLAIVYQALTQAGGNHRRAAALLGVHRSSFTRMLHRLERGRHARLRREETPELARGTDLNRG